jgi:hypothetical protein
VKVLKRNGLAGGFFVWLNLSVNVEADLVAFRSKLEERFVVESGSSFETWRDKHARFNHSIRSSFGWRIRIIW